MKKIVLALSLGVLWHLHPGEIQLDQKTFNYMNGFWNISPVASISKTTHWSSCSREYLALAFAHGMEYCLRNRPRTMIGPVCGNGFLEPGEQCDCGLPEFCDNRCCDPTTCMLTPNSTCATGQCCDLNVSLQDYSPFSWGMQFIVAVNRKFYPYYLITFWRDFE